MPNKDMSGFRDLLATSPSEDSLTTVGSIGRLAALQHPEKIALDDGTTRLTYRELTDRTDRLITAMRRLGVEKGDVIAAFLPNSITYVAIALAAARVGAVFAPVNPRFKEHEISYILQIAQPHVAFIDSDRADMITEIARQKNIKGIALVVVESDISVVETITDEAAITEPLQQLPSMGAQDYFSLMFTSGTTGRPKGALASHGARMTWIRSAIDFYGLDKNDIYLGAMPLVHSAGLTFALMHLAVGGTVHVLRNFDSTLYLKRVIEKKVTSSLVVPTMLSMILEELNDADGPYRMASLKRLVTCGAPLPWPTKKAVLGRITDRFYDYYGSTESNSMTALEPQDQLRKRNSVGRAFPGVKIKVVNELGAELSPRKVGEVWCLNPSVMSCYKGDPNASAAAFTNGWFHTGDLGYLDEEGYLYLVGRINDIIISGGVNMYPAEIEEVIMTHPAVLDCAIAAVSDEKWGQTVGAYVVLRPGQHLTADDIRAHCRQRLADYKKPRHVTFMPALPKNAGGKTIKAALPGIDATLSRSH